MPLEDRGESSTLSPGDAFAVLANETRFEIVQALWERYEPEDPANLVKFGDLYDSDATVTFSELYEHVGYDDTGNFNYHLEQLTDHFVRRTETGYELTEAGFEVARSVVAGTVCERPRLDTAEIDERCPQCDAPVVVAYDNHHIRVSCRRCLGLWQNAEGDDGVLFTFAFPPTGLTDRSAEEAFHAALVYNLTRIRSFILGVCPDCSGVVAQSLDICEAHEPADRGGCPRCHRRHAIEVVQCCRQCKSVARGPLTIGILAHPQVTAFYHEQGVDHRFASWETFERGVTVTEDVLETNPLRIALTIPCGDDELRLRLDEELALLKSTPST
ncbi:ArsR family transcriptional regulator [Natrialbaceae archaeon A-CW3]